MKTLLRHFVCFVCFVGLTATAHAQKNVQKSDATATRDEITADLKFGTGKTGTFLTGSALTLNSGSTLTLNGALTGTVTGGTLNLSAATITFPATVATLTGTQTLTNKTLTAPVLGNATVTSISGANSSKLVFGTATAAALATRSDYAFYSIGDSLTAGGNYQNRLLTHLNGWHSVNHGISGQTTTTMAARFSANVASRGDANYVAIWGGINDIVAGASAATIQANLQAMYTAAQSAGIKVIALKISPFKTNADWTSPRQTVLDTVNAWISSTATGVDYIVDTFTLLEDPGAADTLLAAYDSGDHLHLSTAGYNAVGDAINTAVGTWTATETADVRLYLGATALLAQTGDAALTTNAALTIEDTTDATVMGMGSIFTRGGAAITKAARIGTTLDIGTNLTIRGTDNTSGIGTGTLQIPGGGAYIGGNIVGAGYLSVPGSITSSGNGTLTAGNYVSNATSGGFEALASGTSYRYFRQANTGGNLYVGLESSAAGGFFTGTNAYESVWYSPSNATYFRTPTVRLSNDLTVGAIGRFTDTTAATSSAGAVKIGAQTGTDFVNIGGGKIITGDELTVGGTISRHSAALPEHRLVASTTGTPFGYTFYSGSDYEASLKHQTSNGVTTLDVGRSSSWGGKFDLYADTTRVLRATKTTLTLDGNVTVSGTLALSNTVNTVSPTSPNRTITIVINGTTYYLHAKTTND